MEKLNDLLNNYVENNNALLQVFINNIIKEKDKEIAELKKQLETKNKGEK